MDRKKRGRVGDMEGEKKAGDSLTGKYYRTNELSILAYVRRRLLPSLFLDTEFSKGRKGAF